MRDRLKALLFFILYWLAFMILVRAVFLLYNYDFTKQLTTGEILKVFLYGLKMDGSISGYVVMFTGLMLSISVFTTSKWVWRILTYVNLVFLIISCLVVIVDMELYRHWGFRLNTTPFFYLGKEAMGSIEPAVVIKTFSILIPLVVIFTYLLVRKITQPLYSIKPGNTKAFVVMIVLTALVFIPIRGSLSVAPMNTGFVYFHKTKAFANHAAINVVWNFLNSVFRGNSAYPENFFDKKLAHKYFDSLYIRSDTTKMLFKTTRPNVLLVVLESFTAGVIEPLGGIKGVAPNLSNLAREGILFTNFYGNGDRTDKGIVSILSGYPAQPQTSIIKFPSKAQHLPYLSKKLNQLGYHSSFVYGGDVDFANFRSYLTNCQFEHITSVDDFPEELYTSKWGVHDHYVFNRTLAECDTTKGPFFKVMLSLSSHEPFDVPMEPYIKGKDGESLFLNACHYTDKSLGSFISSAKQKPWWKNTIVIFIADHGHPYPGNKKQESKERFQIPMIWIGGALTKQDTTISTYATQTDIANTLLAQLDKPSDEFSFSKNILDKNAQSFAVYFFNNGYGFIKPHQYIIYDNTGMQFLKSDSASQHDLDVSKAYQQVLYEDYNKR
jgi:phosphoglycerol transferase MdoB-like AlkP superfamily enzyme